MSDPQGGTVYCTKHNTFNPTSGLCLDCVREDVPQSVDDYPYTATPPLHVERPMPFTVETALRASDLHNALLDAWERNDERAFLASLRKLSDLTSKLVTQRDGLARTLLQKQQAELAAHLASRG